MSKFFSRKKARLSNDLSASDVSTKPFGVNTSDLKLRKFLRLEDTIAASVELNMDKLPPKIADAMPMITAITENLHNNYYKILKEGRKDIDILDDVTTSITERLYAYMKDKPEIKETVNSIITSAIDHLVFALNTEFRGQIPDPTDPLFEEKMLNFSPKIGVLQGTILRAGDKFQTLEAGIENIIPFLNFPAIDIAQDFVILLDENKERIRKYASETILKNVLEKGKNGDELLSISRELNNDRLQSDRRKELERQMLEIAPQGYWDNFKKDAIKGSSLPTSILIPLESIAKKISQSQSRANGLGA